MSSEALQKYEEALNKQHSRNEARAIRKEVTQARRSPHTAGLRWPFELLQNALDAGPRNGRPSVTIRLRCSTSRVVFEHDGAPFTCPELASLLSGGSSKEFESDLTTGRFGTGFLVTHVLAERTVLRGLLAVTAGCEQFDLVLDRRGHEDAILENIHLCKEAIGAAITVSDLDGVPSASFEYPLAEDSTLILGLGALKQALPYVYVTRQSLGRVELEINQGITEIWRAGEVLGQSVEDGYVEHRSVRVERDATALPEIQVFRFMTGEGAPAAALMLVERTEGGWKVRLPESGAPRIFREYPLRGAGFLPISFVLDGKFDPDQERSRLLMSDKDKELLEDAFAAAVVAVKYAFDQKWEGAHLLARACKSNTAFDPTDAEEKRWWTRQLAAFAERLAKLPVVECTWKFLPAIASERPFADFIVPRLLPNSAEDETTVERMWPLVKAATGLEPPRKELAFDWTQIAEGWHDLGVQLSHVTVSSLAEHVRMEAKSLDQLRVVSDRTDWLATFLDVVGECWSKRTGVELSVLTGLLPNQNRWLHSPTELCRDEGIPEQLKDICHGMGLEVRAKLFLSDFDRTADAAGLAYLPETIKKAIQTSLSENTVLDDALKHLRAKLPLEKECGTDTAGLQKASIQLLFYLWKSKGKDAASLAREVPLITSEQSVVRWGPRHMMLAPVCTWDESARPFAIAYPPWRVLADMYAGLEDEGISNTVSALVAWGIAIADVVTAETPELKEQRLAALSYDNSNTEGIVVRGQQFSQIALLQPEVLERCQERTELARALLGLVLSYVAPKDNSWQEERIVRGRKGGEDVEVHLQGALWLADLKSKAWVPVPGEDNKLVKTFATATTLRDLLDPVWLDKNHAAIKLLTERFGFDGLELRLLGIAPDSVKRQELRDGLAKLVESGGADPELYALLAEEVEARRRRSRDIDRCRRLGIAVQEAIKSAMESYGLKLKLVDKGFDYEVELIEDAATRFEFGPYLLEVKATTTGEARLTPTQAETASEQSSRYVLCVVDLRNFSAEELDADWTAARVETLAKMVADIGGKVEETCLWVDEARSSLVPIRNESALRYEVSLSVWEPGVSISEWVAKTAEHLAESAAE